MSLPGHQPVRELPPAITTVGSLGIFVKHQPAVGDRDRRPAPDRHAMTSATMREVVPQRMVLSTTVVPEHDRAGSPLVAALEIRLLDLLEQQSQHRIAFPVIEFDDAAGEDAVDEQHLATIDRVDTDNRMFRSGIRLVLVLHPVVAIAVDQFAIVHRGQPLEESLQRFLPVMERAKAGGVKTTIVSNGFWGKKPARARET